MDQSGFGIRPTPKRMLDLPFAVNVGMNSSIHVKTPPVEHRTIDGGFEFLIFLEVQADDQVPQNIKQARTKQYVCLSGPVVSAWAEGFRILI